MAAILQVNFKWDLSEAERDEHFTHELANRLSNFPGLRWKVWITDEDTGGSGGIYLFDDRRSAQARADALVPILEGLPKTSDISMRIFDIREDLSEITRAPLGEPTTA